MHKNPNHVSDTKRDKSRRVDSKRCSMTRRAARRGKSARLFLAFAFPAEFAF